MACSSFRRRIIKLSHNARRTRPRGTRPTDAPLFLLFVRSSGPFLDRRGRCTRTVRSSVRTAVRLFMGTAGPGVPRRRIRRERHPSSIYTLERSRTDRDRKMYPHTPCERCWALSYYRFENTFKLEFIGHAHTIVRTAPAHIQHAIMLRFDHNKAPRVQSTHRHRRIECAVRSERARE